MLSSLFDSQLTAHLQLVLAKTLFALHGPVIYQMTSDDAVCCGFDKGFILNDMSSSFNQASHMLMTSMCDVWLSPVTDGVNNKATMQPNRESLLQLFLVTMQQTNIWAGLLITFRMEWKEKQFYFVFVFCCFFSFQKKWLCFPLTTPTLPELQFNLRENTYSTLTLWLVDSTVCVRESRHLSEIDRQGEERHQWFI